MALGPTQELGKLWAVIAAAAAVVTSTFGLFNSVLADLMPNVPGASQAVKFVSFGTLVLLLILMLVIRARLSGVSQRIWAAGSFALLMGAVLVYFLLSDLVRERVYAYPPGAPQDQSELQVSAPLHELGRKRAENMDIATAVSVNGGPATVNGRQLLWSTAARNEVIGTFVRYYVLLALLLTSSLFMAAIAVWRGFSNKPASRASVKKPRAPRQTPNKTSRPNPP